MRITLSFFTPEGAISLEAETQSEAYQLDAILKQYETSCAVFRFDNLEGSQGITFQLGKRKP